MSIVPVLLFIVPVFAIACWIIFSSVRALLRNELDAVWRKRAVILAIVGVGIGVWLAFFAEFEPAANAKFSRAPIPTVIWQLHDDVWRKIVPPLPVQILAMITDFISGIAAGLLPVKIAAFLKQARAEFIPAK
jgi:hypothetical protein